MFVQKCFDRCKWEFFWILNTNKPKRTLKLIPTKNLIWSNFEKRLFEKSTILSMEFPVITFLFQMLLKSWLIAWSMVKLNKNPNLKRIFTMNCSIRWKKWRLVFRYWKFSRPPVAKVFFPHCSGDSDVGDIVMLVTLWRWLISHIGGIIIMLTTFFVM